MGKSIVRWCLTIVLCVSTMKFVVAAETSPAKTPAGPLSPAESQAAFVLDASLKIEVVAAEPEVIDPVAVQFGSDGSLWVVEMRDYPHGPAAGQAPKSRIKRLRDQDGDGRFESAQVFADELLFVTGVLPYRDGLIATLAGKILFLADRDGDGTAEYRETWFSGFAEENSQLRANHPTFGPDGYVYIANGLRGGKIVAERPEWKKDREPLVITGFDFRFHPETGDFSAVNGHGQFGLTFDDFGRQFVCSNRNPCQHIVFDDRYLRQNPLYGVRQVMHDVCVAGENSRLYPISKAWTTSTLHANQFTAACGVTIYRGNGMPAEYYGNAFTCDPTGNLVHREVVTPSGATFTGRSPYEGREFLASPDTWFRPVNLAHGPDGALYVVDMYRAVIEHPDFMPEELKTRPDLLLGTDRGRIWRVTSREAKPVVADVSKPLTPAQALKDLGHPNSYQRDRAFRFLIEQQPADVIAEQVLPAVQGQSAVARSLGLRLLEAWGTLTPAQVVAALGDAAPEVRETALLLGERWWSDAAVSAALMARLQDDSARVRFQAVLALSLAPAGPQLVAPLAAVCRQDAHDPWTRAAVLTAVRDQAAGLLAVLLTDPPGAAMSTAGLVALCHDLAEVSAAPAFDGTREPVWQALLAAPETESSAAMRWAVLDGLGQGLRRRGIVLANSAGFPSTAAGPVQAWLNTACQNVGDESQPMGIRLQALAVARQADVETATAAILPLVMSSATDVTLQQAAFDALAGFPQPELATPLLEFFGGAPPSARRGILDVLLANDARTAVLITALEQQQVKATELDPTRAQRLINHRDPALRARARKVLEAATAERGAVLTTYAPVLTLKADPLRGRQIFEKQCVTCHRVGDLGVNVGPDIADTRTKTPDVLLTAILDPNRAIDNNYFGYTVILNDGRVQTGIITAETSASITLRQPEGKTDTILRSDIDELRNTGMSLMPVGFEKNITPEQMADLISFLKNWRYLDGDVPLSATP